MVLSPKQEATLDAAFQQWMREAAKAQEEFDDMTPEEWREMQQAAVFQQFMRKSPEAAAEFNGRTPAEWREMHKAMTNGRKIRKAPSEVPDEVMIALYAKASGEPHYIDAEHGTQFLRSEKAKYQWMSAYIKEEFKDRKPKFEMAWESIRDRVCKLKREGLIPKK